MFDLPHNFGDYTLVAFIGRTRGGFFIRPSSRAWTVPCFWSCWIRTIRRVGVEDFLMKARARRH